MDNLTSEQRRKNMQAVKSKGTKIEIVLAKKLWGRYLRFSKNDKTIFGKPDFVFKKVKVAVFVDGEFWHGKDWGKNKFRYKTNKRYWLNKIERNIKRDIEVNKKLKKDGWKVIRFWGKEVLNKTTKCANKVERVVNENKRKNIY